MFDSGLVIVLFDSDLVVVLFSARNRLHFEVPLLVHVCVCVFVCLHAVIRLMPLFAGIQDRPVLAAS